MSEYSFSCPSCGEVISCDSSYIGHKAQCPYCQQKFIIPDQDNGDIVEYQDSNAESPKQPKKRKIKNSTIMLSMIALLGVMVVSLMVVVAWLVLRDNDDRSNVPQETTVATVSVPSQPKPAVKEKMVSPPQKKRVQNGAMSAAEAMKKCVTITCIGGVGSGFFVEHNGQIKVVTCRHVVEDEPVVLIKDINGTEYSVKKVLVSKNRDIGVIELESGGAQLSFQILRDVSSVDVNTELVCYGDSEGTGVIVPCYGKLLGIGPNSVETDTPFVPGNSGGPVVSKSNHEVVGVASVLTRLSEGSKWVKGTRFEKQTRHFAVRIDNLDWDDLESTNDGVIKENDFVSINKIAADELKNRNVDKAIALYTYSAEHKNAEALNTLGEFLVVRGEKGDIDAALKLFEKAAGEGSSDGKVNVGLCYMYGRGVRKDSAKAVECFKEAVDAGNKYACYLMGVCHRDGQGVPKNIDAAIQMFTKASDAGEMHAQNALGDCYWEGVGVKKDWNKAHLLFKASAAQKYAEAEWNMGFSYEHEIGVKKDMVVAAQWYLKSAEQGYGMAQDKMGDLYRDGEGVPHDDDLSYYWYEKGANQGVAGAQYSLGCCYRDGKGVSMDMKKAVACFLLSANQGYAAAQNQMGLRYENGESVPRDLHEAKKWYERAARNGLKVAASNVALMYREGKGVNRNFDTALWWYEKAEDEKNAGELIYEAAAYYSERKDYDEAINWYWKRSNEVEAQNSLGVMYWNSERYDQAFKWFEKASRCSYKCTSRGWANFNLGKCYLYGKGVKENRYIARDYFNYATRDGIDVDDSWYNACRY